MLSVKWFVQQKLHEVLVELHSHNASSINHPPPSLIDGCLDWYMYTWAAWKLLTFLERKERFFVNLLYSVH